MRPPYNACGSSVSSSGTLPISCNKPARFAFFGFRPSSLAIIPQRLAVSRACWRRFCPYEERYFILPTMRISSGCKPWIPKSMAVRLPVSMISLSNCFLTFATTSSMRAGWIRPSETNWWSAKRQISRRTGSKPDITIASGVSSTTISTPVAASRARILRPSRPIILPFTSSLSMWNTLTEFSIAVSVATR